MGHDYIKCAVNLKRQNPTGILQEIWKPTEVGNMLYYLKAITFLSKSYRQFSYVETITTQRPDRFFLELPKRCEIVEFFHEKSVKEIFN
jgi:hypothetical protein